MSPKDYSFAFWTLTFLLLFYSTFAHASIVHDVDCAAKPSVQTYESPIRMKFGAEPRGRGTWGILISCTATFAFCVWTTVHPNILPDASVQYRTLYKAVMMVIGVINPEGLMQSSARSVQDGGRDGTTLVVPSRPPSWTDGH
ncbi:hypothetical protein BZA77DRAFT_355116 [Pyronema omphalodes]|nr:hypothetical protein BZA77DRAFT_355116 [Pyronema omphalodes]